MAVGMSSKEFLEIENAFSRAEGVRDLVDTAIGLMSFYTHEKVLLSLAWNAFERGKLVRKDGA